MKKSTINFMFPFALLWMALISMFVISCDNEDELEVSGPPVIDEVRNYAAAPDDTAVTSVNTGQWVVLIGSNLRGVSEVYFNGFPATINNALFSDENLVIQIPSITFQLVPRDAFNEIVVKNDKGADTYEINIAGAPEITHVRNYADSPNDTILNALALGQHINIIGFNLKDATTIAFQGLPVDLASVVYTDTSAIIQVPDDFSDSDLSQKNKISYTNEVGTGTFSIKILVPEIEVDPFLELLTGGVGPGKTWVIDFDATGTSMHFPGPIGFSGDELRWGDECATAGGNCWTWFPEWQTWMPGPTDYGSMTFSVGEDGTIVTVNQKVISTSGVFEGSYSLSFEAKTLTFAGVVPLNMGWTSADWSSAHVLNLNENTMRLGFKHKDKAELEIYHYIAK